MKILNRPMFRMGGPIKEGIMNGIQEPKRGRVDGPGSYSGEAEKFQGIFKGPGISQAEAAQMKARNKNRNDMKNYKNFTYKYTKTRKKTLLMKKAYELLFLDEMIKYMNKKCKLNCVFNENHIYYGPNLQEADNHGLCFIFPQMIYLYLEYRCDERHASRIFNEETINDFILNCMSMYDPKIKTIKDCYIDEVGNIEFYFRKQKHHIPRKILNHVIGLLTLRKYLKKIKA